MTILRTLSLSLAAALLVACSGEVPEGADYDKRRTTPAAELSDADIAKMSVTDIADSLIDGGNEVKDLLARVDGEDSARAVLPELEALAESYGRVFERFETLADAENIGFRDITALAARAPRVVAAQQGVMKQISRIDQEHPEAREVLREALEDFGQSKGVEVEVE